MKKLMLYGPRDLRLEDFPSTLPLAPGQVRIRTMITGVSTGTERTLYTGSNPQWSNAIRGPLPYDMGYNNVGVVTEIGAEVTRFKVGDIVYSIAPHASEDVFDQNGVITRVPVNVSAEDAVYTHLLSLGLHALRRGDFSPGSRIAVIGMGIIGLCTVALAKALGVNVVAIGRGADRLNAAHQLGADLVIDAEDPDSRAQVTQCAVDQSIDIAVLIGSTWSAMHTACDVLRHGGTISLIGFPGVDGPSEDFNPFDADWFYQKQLTYAAVSFVPRAHYPPHEVRWTLVRNYDYLLYLMQQGKLTLTPLITDKYPATEYQQVYERMDAGDRTLIGAIFSWDEDSLK